MSLVRWSPQMSYKDRTKKMNADLIMAGIDLALKDEKNEKKLAASSGVTNVLDSGGGEESSGISEEDPLIRAIGSIGRFQLLLFLLTSLTVVIHGWQLLVNKFLTFPVDFSCARPNSSLSLGYLSHASWLAISAPKKESGLDFDRCKIFDVDFAASDGVRPDENTPTVECTQWDFSGGMFQNTIQSRWGLVCARSFYPRLAQALFFAGNIVGVLMAGFLADAYGRMRTYRIWLVVWIVSTISARYADNFWLWVSLRFVAGGSSIAYNTCQTVYCIEFAGQRWRSVTNIVFRGLPFGIGHISLAGLVYLLPDMYDVELTMGVCGLPLLVVLCFLPESPRWLLVTGRLKQGIKVVRLTCRLNNRLLTPSSIDEITAWAEKEGHAGKSKETIFTLCKHPCVRRNLALVCFAWLSTSMAYFGLIYNTPSFDWHVLLVFIAPVVVFLFVPIFLPYLENKLGRKSMLTIMQIMCGVALLAILAVPKGVYSGNWPIIVLAMLGQEGCSMSFSHAYSLTRELFPTQLRTTCLAIASSSARIGAVISPLIAAAVEQVSPEMPAVVYGVVSLTAGILCFWIWPETKDHKLPDSLAECEALASTSNPWVRPWTWCSCGKANIGNTTSTTTIETTVQQDHTRR